MTNNKLNSLVASGAILDYEYVSVDEEGNVGQESDFRNTERLVLHFPNEEYLIIDTLCSGSREDTSLFFK